MLYETITSLECALNICLRSLERKEAHRPGAILNRVYEGVTNVSKTIGSGNVVKEMKLGDTTIKICDDYYRGQTPMERQAIIDRMVARAQRALIVAAEREVMLDE